MIRDLGHFCAHIGQIGPGEPSENSEMSEMTLPSRHSIRNLNPGGLRPGTLPLGHGIIFNLSRMTSSANTTSYRGFGYAVTAVCLLGLVKLQ